MKKISLAILSALLLLSLALLGACKGKRLTVSFDAGDGVFENGLHVLEVEVKKNEKVAPPENPALEGADFDCWTNGGKPYDFGEPVTQDLFLEARYTAHNYDLVTVSYSSGEGYVFVCDIASGEKVKPGTVIEFTLEIGAFYGGKPEVRANGSLVEERGGKYSYTANSDVTFAVSGISKETSSMAGLGTANDPYRVTRPADLLYIAEMVNLPRETAYDSAYYQLDADIDLKGEELKVIGDNSSEYAYFSGFFNGNGHTIKNFTINASIDGRNDGSDILVAGLFGYVQFDPTDNFGGYIVELTIENFTVNARAEGANVYAGGLIGYGIGCSALVCTAKNGTVNVSADDNWFGFAGGLIGCLRAVVYNNVPFMAEASYADCDVDVYCTSGLMYAAGGIVGYLTSDDEAATAYVLAGVSRGEVNRAVMAGGVAGYMGEGTSVSTSYSTGTVVAGSSNLTVGSEEGDFLANSFAGGIAGYAENLTVLSDCFEAATLRATAAAGNEYAHAGEYGNGLLGGARAAGYSKAFGDRIVLFNCYGGESGGVSDSSFTSSDFIKNTLKWKSEDWVIRNGAYPEINREVSNIIFTVNFTFEGYISPDGGRYGPSIEIEDTYRSLAAFIADGNAMDYREIDARLFSGEVPMKEGDVAYGFFFDEQHTLRMPYSYVLTRDLEAYVAFHDVSDAVGAYSAYADGQRVEIVLNKDGSASCSDGRDTRATRFCFDGEHLTIYDVRLAMYSGAEITGENDYISLLALRDFGGCFSGNTLELWDGTYFTKERPLSFYTECVNGDFCVKKGTSHEIYSFYADGTGRRGDVSFTYTVDGATVTVTEGRNVYSCTLEGGAVTQINGEAAQPLDKFYGTWEFSSSAFESYFFDGAGAWTHTLPNGASVGGGYNVKENGKAELDNGMIAYFENGRLMLENDAGRAELGAQSGLEGLWINPSARIALSLNGLGAEGRGYGRVDYAELGYYYELTYAPELGHIFAYFNGEFFGYFDYAYNEDVLRGYLYYTGGLSAVTLYRVDDYYGEWISDSELFADVDFNGFGSYVTVPGMPEVTGFVTINGEQVKYTLGVHSLEGSFTYQGTLYTITYNLFDSSVTVKAGDSSHTLERIDSLCENDLIADDGTRYSFDGRGNLASGGVMTVSGEECAEYNYKVKGSGAEIFEGGQKVGQLVLGERFYELTISDVTRDLRIITPFMGAWALGGEYALFSIGGLDLNGNARGRYIDEDVTLTYNARGYLTFAASYFYMNTVYVIMVGAEGEQGVDYSAIAVSSSPTLGDDYILASPADDLYLESGYWRNSLGYRLRFDGASGLNAFTGSYGVSELFAGSISTDFGYAEEDGEYYMWTLVGATMMFKLVPCAPEEEGTTVFVSPDGKRAFKRTRVDILYRAVATDQSGNKYFFNGDTFENNGRVTVTSPQGDVREYAYDFIEAATTSYVVDIHFEGGVKRMELSSGPNGLEIREKT